MKKNEQRPTPYQIETGALIIPKEIYRLHRDELQGEFTAIAFGKEIPKRKLDQSFRVRVPLKGHVEPGESVAVRVENGVLVIERAGGSQGRTGGE